MSIQEDLARNQEAAHEALCRQLYPLRLSSGNSLESLLNSQALEQAQFLTHRHNRRVRKLCICDAFPWVHMTNISSKCKGRPIKTVVVADFHKP
jgi:hypothetical protein